MTSSKIIELDGERWINIASFEKYLYLLEDGFKRDSTYTGIDVLNYLEESRNLMISHLATVKLKKGFINL